MDFITFISESSVVFIAVSTPVILGLVSLCKLYVDSKYAPLLSLVFGLLIAIPFSNLPLGWAILLGVLCGLSASGLYSGVKKANEALD